MSSEELHMSWVFHICSHRGFRIPRPQPEVFLMAVAVGVAASAFAQTETGTVIIIGYSQHKIVIAADSRQVGQDGAHRDNGCKIAAIDNKVIFAAFGEATSILSDGTFGWDATREARTALADTPHLQSDKDGEFFDRLALNWGKLIGPEISQHMTEADLSAYVDGQFVTSGIIIGVGEF